MMVLHRQYTYGSCIWLISLLLLTRASAGSAATNLPAVIEINPNTVTALRERGTNRPFVAIGLNYFGPHIGWTPKLWQQFDEKKIAQHLDLIRDHNFNTIRVFLTLDAFHQEPGVVRSDGVAKFRKLLDLCQTRSIRVIPSGPDHWEGIPEWRQNKDPFANDDILSADEKWWSAFVSKFKDEPTILAWDLLNEPAIRWDTPAMRLKWNDWLKHEYGSQAKIASAWTMSPNDVGQLGSIEVPPKKSALKDQRLFDYQRFRQFIANEWTRRLTSAIRRSDPKHLVTIGYIQWVSTSLQISGAQYHAGFDIRSNASFLDFVTIHYYPLATPRPDLSPEGIPANAADFENLLFECSVGKPMMIGEFGWYGGGKDMRQQANEMARQILAEHHPAYIADKTKTELDKLALAQQNTVIQKTKAGK